MEIKNIPSLEELVKLVRKIKVKVPEKKAALDKELLFLRVQGATYADTDVIKENDIAILNVTGKSDRYNKTNVAIAVGMNLYNEEIEKNLIGMKIGEIKTLIIDDEKVCFTVVSIKKKVYSELTLDKVKAEDPDITSIAEYEDKMYNNICDKIIEEKSFKLQINPMIIKMHELTDLKYDMSELDPEFASAYDMSSRGLSDEQILDYQKSALGYIDLVDADVKDGMTKEDYIETLSESAIKDYYDRAIKMEIENCLMNVAFLEKNGMDLSEEAYENHLKELSEKYNVPVETYKQQSPYYVYKYFTADRNVQNIMLEYLKKNNMIDVIVTK